MQLFHKALIIFGVIGVFALARAGATEPSRTIDLWPQVAPGEKGDLGEERDMTKSSDGLVAGKPVIRLGNISKPIMALFPAPGGSETPAVLVCPGGGYNILAWDLEGSEVCDWLNSKGVTGVLLKYRVPKRPGLERYAPPLQDAQRAMGLLRARAKEFGIDKRRIGVLGFSAGGHLAAALSNNYQERTYPTVDEADANSCRPDFTVLIYPAYLTLKDEGDKIAPELKITSETPPTFIAMAEDDPVRVENALVYGLALKNAKVPVELHVYPSGGHGYGLRPTTNLVSSWPRRAEDWLRSREVLK